MRPGDFRETDEREDWGIMQENRGKNDHVRQTLEMGD
jgi:hypothetical protein